MIDALLPRFDFVERHSIATSASPEGAYAAVRTANLARSPIVKALLAMRGMKPSMQLPPKGFHLLAENPPHEIVIGVEGPFWKPSCKLHDLDAASYAQPVPSHCARAAWNFFIEPGRISTETRILCSDDARWKFRLYWLMVRPFSGLIRRFMLRAIRDEAERA